MEIVNQADRFSDDRLKKAKQTEEQKPGNGDSVKNQTGYPAQCRNIQTEQEQMECMR